MEIKQKTRLDSIYNSYSKNMKNIIHGGDVADPEDIDYDDQDVYIR